MLQRVGNLQQFRPSMNSPMPTNNFETTAYYELNYSPGCSVICSILLECLHQGPCNQ